MSDWRDEARTLRHRLKDAEDLIRRLHREPFAHDAGLVVRTRSQGAYPTSAASYFACDILTAGGDAAEGAPAELTAVTGARATLHALNVGTKVPPVGTEVLAVYDAGSWVFQFDGSES